MHPDLWLYHCTRKQVSTWNVIFATCAPCRQVAMLSSRLSETCLSLFLIIDSSTLKIHPSLSLEGISLVQECTCSLLNEWVSSKGIFPCHLGWWSLFLRPSMCLVPFWPLWFYTMKAFRCIFFFIIINLWLLKYWGSLSFSPYPCLSPSSLISKLFWSQFWSNQAKASFCVC